MIKKPQKSGRLERLAIPLDVDDALRGVMGGAVTG